MKFIYVVLLTLAAIPATAQDFLRESRRTNKPQWGQIVTALAVNEGRNALVGGINRERVSRDQAKVSRSTAEYNNRARDFDFEGATFEIIIERDDWSSYGGQRGQSWLRAGIRQLLTNVGAQAAWSLKEIEEESRQRERNVRNRWVDKKTLHGEGTISIPDYQVVVTSLRASRKEDLDLGWGRFFQGLDLDFGREVNYTGLVLNIVDKETGKDITSYKVVGYSSTTNKAEADVFTGLFGNRARGRYRGNTRDSGKFSSQEDALAQMGRVLQNKNNARRDHP